MPSKQTLLLIGAVLLAIIVADRCHDGQVDAWEQRVQRVEQHAKDLQKRVDEATAEADSLSEAADEALRAAETAEATLRVRIDTVRAETPENLREHPAIVRRDSIINAQSDIITQTRRAYDLERQASGRLRAALADATARGDSLRDVLADRPSDRPWWLPRLGAGVAAGLDTQGRPNTVAGATISWEIKF